MIIIIIEQAKMEMERIVKRLYELDPFWNRCSCCCLSGHCCEGANPNFSAEEKEIFLENSFAKEDVIELQGNISENRTCPFRFQDKCLIHDYRPLNCHWTPYQAVCDNNNVVHYFIISDTCLFKKIEIKKDKINFELCEEHYVWLPHADGVFHCHIFLNTLNFIKQGYDWNIPATEVALQIIKNKRGVMLK